MATMQYREVHNFHKCTKYYKTESKKKEKNEEVNEKKQYRFMQ